VTERLDLVQASHEDTPSWRAVLGVADELSAHLSGPTMVDRLLTANQPGQSSGLVQSAFVDEAVELGFRSEAKGLFATYDSALRPDYYLPIEASGILLEVERGKTTINNMDLLDFWKCHICEQADYLFLMVPTELRQNPTMSPRREFATVSRRLATFFRPGNETNVLGLVLFGY